ncbi:MAG TPA: hypothetical protein VK741_23375 [Acetobacteraceae bacterium]|nr:hypothetical protein [Acetobacteraceae bacterium]
MHIPFKNPELDGFPLHRLKFNVGKMRFERLQVMPCFAQSYHAGSWYTGRKRVSDAPFLLARALHMQTGSRDDSSVVANRVIR